MTKHCGRPNASVKLPGPRAYLPVAGTCFSKTASDSARLVLRTSPRTAHALPAPVIGTRLVDPLPPVSVGREVIGQRPFVSPDLPPGQPYSYELRATWQDQGRQVTETRRVSFRAGEKVDVDFGAPKKVGPKEERLPNPTPGKQ